MLLGYDKEGNIKFMFSDEDYLNRMFPKNTATISNFWKNQNHGLKELFIPNDKLKGIDDFNNFKVVSGKIIRNERKNINSTLPPENKVHIINRPQKGIVKNQPRPDKCPFTNKGTI